MQVWVDPGGGVSLHVFRAWAPVCASDAVFGLSWVGALASGDPQAASVVDRQIKAPQERLQKKVLMIPQPSLVFEYSKPHNHGFGYTVQDNLSRRSSHDSDKWAQGKAF